MKYLLLITFIALILNVGAQSKFQWATAVQDMQLEYLSVKAHPAGGVVALAAREHLPSTSSSQPAFFEGGGQSHRTEEINLFSATWVLQLDEDGKLLWLKAVPKMHAQIPVLAIAPDSTILLFAAVEEEDEDEDGISYGSLEGLTDEEVPVGKMIVRLSETGNLLETIPLKQLQTTEDKDFLVYGLQAYQDGFLLNGYSEDGHLTENTRETGGDFVICFTADGTVRWLDQVAFGDNGYTEQGNTVDSAPDGTIYLGGTYFGKATFSNGQKVEVPRRMADESKMTEAYIISYDSHGQILWIRTDQSNSVFHRLKATNDGVYVGHEILGNLAFGKKADTLTNNEMVLTFLSKKGKSSWNKIIGTGDFYGLELTQDGNMAVLGSFLHWDKQPPHSRKFGAFSLGAEDDVFVLTLDSQGKVTALWSAYLHINIQQPMHLATYGKNSYVALEVQCGPQRGLSVHDSSFPRAKCHGSVPVLGKIK